MFKNKLTLILICFFTAAATAFADKELEEARKAYEKDVREAYEPADPAESFARDAYLLKEADDLIAENDYMKAAHAYADQEKNKDKYPDPFAEPRGNAELSDSKELKMELR